MVNIISSIVLGIPQYPNIFFGVGSVAHTPDFSLGWDMLPLTIFLSGVASVALRAFLLLSF